MNQPTKFWGLTLLFVMVIGYAAAQTENGIVNSGELIQEGIDLHDDEQYTEAIKLYDQVPESDTNYTLALVEKALAYYAKKDYEKTIKLCEEILALGTEYDHNVFVTLGSAYDDLGKPEKALEIYDRGIARFPKNHSILFNKGVTLEKQEKYEEAIEAFKQTLLLNPFHASSHYRLGRLAEQEGEVSKAILCYNTFLIVEPATERSTSVLSQLDRMLSSKPDESKAKGIKLSAVGDNFKDIDVLIKKQLAVNKDYKLESKADYTVIRQEQALLSYLPGHKGTEGFWEKFYLPFYVKLYKEGQFAGFSYFILSSTENQKVQELVLKNKKDLVQFIEWEKKFYNDIVSRRKLPVDGKTVDGTQLYYKNGSLYGFGPYTAEGEKMTGHWEFYYSGGNTMASGDYDAAGKKTGNWRYYHANGKLRKEAVLVNDEENGSYRIFYDNGNLKEAGTMRSGKLNGEVKAYTRYGGLKELHTFKDGIHEGKYEEYHPNGKVSATYMYVNGKLNGAYKSYHTNGKVYINGKFVDDKKEGEYTIYHANEQLQLKKTYTQDKENGAFTRYFKNGKVEQEGTWKNGVLIGTYKLYTVDGQLDEVTNYNDAGKEDGKQQYFDTDGKIYYEADCKDGRLLEYRFIDKTGKPLAEYKLKGKQDVKTYYPDGTLRWSGYMENGKRVGLWKEYYRNSQLESEYNYKDGLLDGEQTQYFYNGKLYSKANYKDGELHGSYKEYFRNGQLYKSIWYDNGDMHGDVYEYDINGTPSSKYSLVQGNYTGNYYIYNVDGGLNSVERYNDDDFTGFSMYDTTGKEVQKVDLSKEKQDVEYFSVTATPVRKGSYANGLLEGDMTGTFINGKPAMEAHYVSGKRNGTWKWYNPDNTLNSIRTYDFGKTDGLYENYDVNGKLVSRYTYINGASYGNGFLYYYNGNKKQEMSQWKDEDHGPTKYIGFNGEHVMTLLYDMGVLRKVIYVNTKAGKPDTVAAPLTGTIEARYLNGKTAIVIDKKDGYSNGRYQEFFEDGTPCRDARYVDGLLDGERKTYYRSGKLYLVEHFKLNDNEGVTTCYYESGKPKAEFTYKHDVLHGAVKYYDEKGTLTAHYIFHNGVMIKTVL